LKYAHTISKHQSLVGEMLVDGRIAFTGIQRSLLSRSGLLSGSGWASWDDSRLTSRKATGANGSGTVSPLGLSLNWLKKVIEGEVKPWVWLHGVQYGIGKTHAARILGVHWIAATSKAALFVPWGTYLEDKKESWSDDSLVLAASLSEMNAVPFLVLDDLCGGTSFSSTWALGQLFILLSERENKPTVFTSNYSIAKFCSVLPKGKVSDRVAHSDILGKVLDRLGKGPGGSFMTDLKFASATGSMRQKEIRSGS